MKCPYCGSDETRVIDTRGATGAVRRRRQCQKCNRRFTTYERVALSFPQVVKRDGRREEFSREKLLAAVRTSCAKRPIPAGALERLADEVETQVWQLDESEIPSRVIGDMVMDRLRELDELSYIRFATLYLPLNDLHDLRQEVERLTEDDA